MALEREREPFERTSGLETDIKAFLGPGTEFQGTLTFEGTIRIDGKVSGEIVSRDTLIVGEEATVEAEINVGVLVARGRIKGNVRAAERIELHETCELVGNITTPKLMIAEGATFQGSCEMPQVSEKVAPLSPTRVFGSSEESQEEREEEEEEEAESP
jgi:cytoskeletal protein CcmA (bactofilin family)